jgi:alpha-tubulin suppressor-like RCC1 family protein
MTEFSPDGREDQPPANSSLPELLTYNDGPTGVLGWLRRHPWSSLLLTAVAIGAGGLWGLRSWSDDAPGVRADLDPITAPPPSPVTSPTTTGEGRPALDVVPTDVEDTVRVGLPQRIAKVGGDLQVADVAGLLEGLLIRVTDGAGNPVPGVQVFFQPAAEDGLVAPSRPRTDSLGLASTTWRLGTGAGVQRLSAEVVGASIPPVTFTATALADTAVTVVAEPSTEDTVQRPSPELEPVPVEPAPVVVVRRTFGVGGTFVCSIASGRAACRGANDRGQLGGGGGGDFESLAVGVSHACGLDASGAASCWGANDGGQLGDGSRADRPAPVPVGTEFAFSTLTAGAGHTCGLVPGGRAACWGRNLSGQLGDGTRDDRSTPTPLPDDRPFQTLVAGWEHTCGLRAGGDLACWGGNGQGQLGDGTRLDHVTPAQLPGSFTSVVAGSRHTCAISGERVLCWGDNSFGQLGDGSTQARTRPTSVEGLPGSPVRLAAGAVHTCALIEGGAAWCWGQNVHGQLGDGTNENRAVPAQVSGGLTFASLFAGGALTCGFTTDGSQYCWGLNQTGQLGDGTRVSRASPVRVGG